LGFPTGWSSPHTRTYCSHVNYTPQLFSGAIITRVAVITTQKEESLISDLAETFDNLNRYKLKLNPTKCSFGVSAGKLLGFLVSTRGIEANPEKIQAILTMGKPTKLHDVQKLAGRVAALSRFVERLGGKHFPSMH
jgi:hypothetical protein